MNTVALKIAIALQNLQSDEKAQTLGEYSILLGVLAVGSVVAMTALSQGFSDAFMTIITELPGYTP